MSSKYKKAFSKFIAHNLTRKRSYSYMLDDCAITCLGQAVLNGISTSDILAMISMFNAISGSKILCDLFSQNNDLAVNTAKELAAEGFCIYDSYLELLKIKYRCNFAPIYTLQTAMNIDEHTVMAYFDENGCNAEKILKSQLPIGVITSPFENCIYFRPSSPQGNIVPVSQGDTICVRGIFNTHFFNYIGKCVGITEGALSIESKENTDSIPICTKIPICIIYEIFVLKTNNNSIYSTKLYTVLEVN